MDRQQHDQWVLKRSKVAFARAKEVSQKLLAEQELAPLSEKVEGVFQEILEERASRRQ